MLAIKNNVMASNAARHLGASYDALAQSVERLSSGLRINSAKDDAAGLAVRELIRADVAVLQQGSRNAQDGISMLQTMEGAMATINENLIRMKELAEQAATGSYSDDQRIIMNSEFEEMASEIDRASNSTQFNNNYMLNTSAGTVKIHVGTTETIDIDKVDMTQSGLDIVTGSSGFEAIGAFGVADVDGNTSDSDAFLNLTSGTGDETLKLDIAFADELAVQVVLTGTVSATKWFSLTEVVEAINTVTLNLSVAGDGTVQAYEMASIEHDNATGDNFLKLSSRTADSGSMTALGTTTGALSAVATLGFTVAVETADDDLLAADMVGAVGTGINILDVDAAVTALTAIGAAITTKDTERAAFGYMMNRLESTISVLNIQAENLSIAESRISDVDVATEMAVLTRNQVLAQAGVAMLAQANAMPQMALTLLR